MVFDLDHVLTGITVTDLMRTQQLELVQHRKSHALCYSVIYITVTDIWTICRVWNLKIRSVIECYTLWYLKFNILPVTISSICDENCRVWQLNPKCSALHFCLGALKGVYHYRLYKIPLLPHCMCVRAVMCIIFWQCSVIKMRTTPKVEHVCTICPHR